MNKRPAILLSALIALLLGLNYLFFTNLQDAQREAVAVARVIDGDTLELKDGRILRLININTPEKNTPESEQSIQYMKRYENKTLEIETLGDDKYNRVLARVYTPEYLNLYLVDSGLAPKFLVDRDEMRKFEKAQTGAVENERGIWKKSPHFGCISAKIDFNNELIKVKKLCSNLSLLSFSVRDESWKAYKFTSEPSEVFTLYSAVGQDNETALFWGSESNIWNNEGDSLFILDPDG